MWKKERYDIHIRLSPEDVTSLGLIACTLNDISHYFNKDMKARIALVRSLYWKIHNKCVEINRKSGK